MIKVKILNPTEDRNEPTFRVMTACKEALKTYSIEITESDDFDYLFVGMNDFMNKNLSLAIEKAVEKISPKDNFPINQNKIDKKPDLFSLTSQTCYTS